MFNTHHTTVAGGNLTLTLTDGEHIHAILTGVVVNGVLYNEVAIHLYKLADGSWNAQRPDHPWEDRIYPHRFDGKESSDAAKKKLKAIITDAVNVWAKSVSPMVFDAAAVDELKRSRARAERKLAELEAEVSALRAEIASIDAKIAQFPEPL